MSSSDDKRSGGLGLGSLFGFLFDAETRARVEADYAQAQADAQKAHPGTEQETEPPPEDIKPSDSILQSELREVPPRDSQVQAEYAKAQEKWLKRHPNEVEPKCWIN